MRRRSRRGGVKIVHDTSRYGTGYQGAIYRNREPTTTPDETAIKENKNCTWTEGEIAKVFDPRMTDEVARERWAAREVTRLRAKGIPLPTILPARDDPSDLCTIPGRSGKPRSVMMSAYGGPTVKDLVGNLDAMRTRLERGEAMTLKLDAMTKSDILSALRELRKDIVLLNANGIVHGDVHEGNIVYDPMTKVAKLIDFAEAGYAKPGTKESESATDLPLLDELIRTIEAPETFLPKRGATRSRRRAGKAMRHTRRRRSFRSR
jgi:tRNA A-37 threonylcarbamoyl transferase component Bud32